MYAVASIQLDCRGPVWSTGLEGMKLSRVLDAGQGLGPWVNGATEDSSKLGLCLKGLAIWDAAPNWSPWRSWGKCDLGSGGSTTSQAWVQVQGCQANWSHHFNCRLLQLHTTHWTLSMQGMSGIKSRSHKEPWALGWRLLVKSCGRRWRCRSRN